MMKSDKGITLVILTVTIIVLLILTGVGLKASYRGLDKVKSSQLETELGLVRQAITENYLQAVAVNKIEILPTEKPVSFWVGERITNFSDIALPEKSSVVETQAVNDFYNKLNQYVCKYQEDFYYRLKPKELSELGISDAKDTYIVNYHTAEVYNETKKIDKNSKLLYLSAISYQPMMEDGDKESFNDWE